MGSSVESNKIEPLQGVKVTEGATERDFYVHMRSLYVDKEVVFPLPELKDFTKGWEVSLTKMEISPVKHITPSVFHNFEFGFEIRLLPNPAQIFEDVENYPFQVIKIPKKSFNTTRELVNLLNGSLGWYKAKRYIDPLGTRSPDAVTKETYYNLKKYCEFKYNPVLHRVSCGIPIQKTTENAPIGFMIRFSKNLHELLKFPEPEDVGSVFTDHINHISLQLRLGIEPDEDDSWLYASWFILTMYSEQVLQSIAPAYIESHSNNFIRLCMNGLEYSFCCGERLPLLRSIPLIEEGDEVFFKHYEPRNRNYIRLEKKIFREISISITDEKNNPINTLANELVTIDTQGKVYMQLHFRKS